MTPKGSGASRAHEVENVSVLPAERGVDRQHTFDEATARHGMRSIADLPRDDAVTAAVLFVAGAAPGAGACNALVGNEEDVYEDGVDEDAGTKQYACDNRASESTCADFWDGASATYAASHGDGVVLDNPCPLDSAIGVRKIVANSGETLFNTYYSFGPTPWTGATASSKCTKVLMGTFQEP